jgi:hypothetical protein
VVVGNVTVAPFCGGREQEWTTAAQRKDRLEFVARQVAEPTDEQPQVLIKQSCSCRAVFDIEFTKDKNDAGFRK